MLTNASNHKLLLPTFPQETFIRENLLFFWMRSWLYLGIIYSSGCSVPEPSPVGGDISVSLSPSVPFAIRGFLVYGRAQRVRDHACRRALRFCRARGCVGLTELSVLLTGIQRVCGVCHRELRSGDSGKRCTTLRNRHAG